MTKSSDKSVHSLILDSGPLIKNDPSSSTLLTQAETLYTIPLVLEEIRDANTRARLENTLFPLLIIRSPKQSSIKTIQDFARKTGDLEVLSRADVHLMALAYELECERNHGDWRLRSSPGQKRLNGAPPSSLREDDHSVVVCGTDSTLEKSSEVFNTSKEGCLQKAKSDENNDTSESVEIQEAFINLTLSNNTNCHKLSDNRVLLSDCNHTVLASEPDSLHDDIPYVEDEDSDGEGWINPSNLKKYQESDNNIVTTPNKTVKTMQVALLTNDFAMQNVLLRMNLNVLSSSLQKISNLRTWVLRCHACFLVTKDMTKQFCGRCGKPTLLRAACSTDKDGNFKIHLKKNMQWSVRGNVYSIPKPKAGTSSGKLAVKGGKGEWGRSLILAEDQREYVNALRVEQRCKDKSLIEEDFFSGVLMGERGRKGGRPTIGAGKNVNSRRRK